MPRGTTILAATSFPPEMAPSYHQDRWAANRLCGFLEANVDAIVAASSTHDVMTQAKYFVCSTFKLFEDPMSATQNKEVAFRARSRLQTRCLSSKCASASGCATKRWSVLTQTIHPQRHVSSVGAFTRASAFHRGDFYLRGSRSTGGSAHGVKKESVFTRSQSGLHHPSARTHMAMHDTHSPVSVDTNTRRADQHLRMPAHCPVCAPSA